ncbi:hypothetical protein GCM10010869_71880 [Mesorhizobium tianshanense]|nr:hypothetical protein GCM10010869_71880 [Mesorhizobium tianshanense]
MLKVRRQQGRADLHARHQPERLSRGKGRGARREALETWNKRRQKTLLAMDKNDGDNLPEWFASRLPEDPVIRADIPWLLVLCVLSILTWAGYALAGSYFL